MKHTNLLLIDGRSLTSSSFGIGVYTTRLVKGLLHHASEFDFRILVPESLELSAIASELSAQPHHFIRVSAPPSVGVAYLDDIISQTAISHFLRKHHPDALFHATNLFWSPLQSGRTLVTLHDVIPHLFPRYFGKYPLRKFMQRRYERFAARSSQVLAVSECTASDATQLAGIPKEKISVLYNWVSEDFLNFDRASQVDQIHSIRKKYNLPVKYWLYLGGYDYRKNIEFLIRAYAHARTSAQAVIPPLVLAGLIPSDLSKPYCDVFGAIRKAGLTSEDVVMPGLIASEDLPALYAEASLLIYPSLYEGFGFPAAEAMAVGTPVLVSDTSSLPEIVRRPECRFDPTDEEGLALKLLDAANDPLQFLCPLPAEFTEKAGIHRYIQIIEELGKR